MRIEYDTKLDFQDVLIRPKRSTLSSRSDVDISRTFRFVHTDKTWTGLPLIASNMDTIGTFEMAHELFEFESMAALHKYYRSEELVAYFRSEASENTFYTTGTSEEDLENYPT